MARTLHAAVQALQRSAYSFDEAALAERQRALDQACGRALGTGASLLRYHELLLFLSAHPASAAQHAQVDREFRRIAAFLRGRPHPASLHNQGLPGVATVSRFSHDRVRQLLAHGGVTVTLTGFEQPRLELAEVLAHTLPSLERAETTTGLDAEGLLDRLGVRPAERLPFLVDQLARLDDRPGLKDQLFDGLDAWVRVQPRSAAFSKAFNRLPGGAPFVQRERLRRYDPRALIDEPLPPPRAMDAAERARVVRVIQDTMTLTARETDPATHIDPGSLRVLDLDRGVSVALFGMVPARQLPVESYVGFTLFRNGLAVAYGGAWPFGPRAAFGMNVFEPYRGGESGWLMCQLLRAYRQTFGVRVFEVDAGQFGLDNPDGIASGAYWYYHKHGFRSTDPALARRAERERARMAADPGHRSSERTLRAFTASSVELRLGPGPAPLLHEWTEAVTRWMRRAHGGRRSAAVDDAVQRFQALGLPGLKRLDADGRRVLAEVALLAQALKVDDRPRLRLLARMVHAKPRDVAAYQRLLLRFIDARPR